MNRQQIDVKCTSLVTRATKAKRLPVDPSRPLNLFTASQAGDINQTRA